MGSAPETPPPASRPSWRSRLFRLMRTFGIFYLAMVAGLLLFEDRLVYQASRASEHWSVPPKDLAVQDVELVSADGTKLHAWWVAPTGWQPEQGAMLFCHGNGGNLSHRGRALKPWLDQQIAVLIFDYPGFGKSEGKPSEAGCYAAGDTAYAWLVREKCVPSERIILYGGSLGSGVAVDMALRHPHWALVLVSAYTSIPDMAQKLFPWMPAKWLAETALVP